VASIDVLKRTNPLESLRKRFKPGEKPPSKCRKTGKGRKAIICENFEKLAKRTWEGTNIFRKKPYYLAARKSRGIRE